jgi:sugar lactone lactonase YvrE
VPLEIGEFQAPDPPSLTGPYQVNERLKSAERIDAGFGPEAVAFDAQGRMVTGVEDGRILRFSADRSAPEVLAQTGGRPLGMKFDAEGNLIVADAEKGLLLLKSDGAVTVLATEAAGAPIVLADDLDIGPDGTVYFSDASVYPLRDKLLTELLDSRPHGRLLAYERGGKTRVLLSGLRFANGVAVSPDGASVLVTETAAYRVTRYWLQGPKQGLSEPFIENLPGFPDNITASPRGGYWLALASPRIPRVERLQRSRFLRQMLLRLPRSWLPAPQPVNYGIVLGLDPDGRVVHNLQDPDGRDAFQVSSAVEYRSMLYLGTLGDSAVKRLPAP